MLGVGRFGSVCERIGRRGLGDENVELLILLGGFTPFIVGFACVHVKNAKRVWFFNFTFRFLNLL